MARTKQVTIIQVPTDEPGEWRDFQLEGQTVVLGDTADAIKMVKGNEIEKFRIVRIVKAGKSTLVTMPRVKIEYD